MFRASAEAEFSLLSGSDFTHFSVSLVLLCSRAFLFRRGIDWAGPSSYPCNFILFACISAIRFDGQQRAFRGRIGHTHLLIHSACSLSLLYPSSPLWLRTRYSVLGKTASVQLRPLLFRTQVWVFCVIFPSIGIAHRFFRPHVHAVSKACVS